MSHMITTDVTITYCPVCNTDSTNINQNFCECELFTCCICNTEARERPANRKYCCRCSQAVCNTCTEDTSKMTSILVPCPRFINHKVSMCITCPQVV